MLGWGCAFSYSVYGRGVERRKGGFLVGIFFEGVVLIVVVFR